MDLNRAERPLFAEMMRQRRKGKRFITAAGLVLLLLVMQVGLMTGCGSSSKTETAATSEDTVTIYYLAKDEKSLNPVLSAGGEGKRGAGEGAFAEAVHQ